MQLNFFWKLYSKTLRRLQYDLGITYIHENLTKLDAIDGLMTHQKRTLDDVYLQKLLIHYFEDELHLSVISDEEPFKEILTLKKMLSNAKKGVGFDGFSPTELPSDFPKFNIEVSTPIKHVSHELPENIFSIILEKMRRKKFSDLFINSTFVSTLLVRHPQTLHEISLQTKQFFALVLPINSSSLKNKTSTAHHASTVVSPIIVHEDSTVRSILHHYGFYEVSAYAHGMKLVRQSVVDYVDKFRLTQKDSLHYDNDVTYCLYLASRVPLHEI